MKNPHQPSGIRSWARDKPPLRSVVLPSLFLMVAMFNLTLPVVGLKELIVDRLGGSVTQASLFFSVEMFAYVLFAPLWGYLSDRWATRRPLIFLGFLASSILYACFGLVSSIELLLALRFVQGAFSVMAWSTLMAIVLDLPNDGRRGRNVGLMGAGLIFGVSFGVPVGGYVVSHFGAVSPLLVAAVSFFVLALATLLLADGPALVVQRSREDRGAAGLGIALRRPRLLLPYFFHFADRYTVGVLVVLLPLYLDTLGAAGPAERGRYLGMFLLPFALLQAFTGRLTDRVGPFPPLIFGSLLYGLGLGLVGISGLLELRWVMLALGVLASVMFPPAIALVGELSSEDTRGAAMGGFNVAGSLGFAVGPLVGAWALPRFGFGGTFILAGQLELLACGAAVVCLIRWRKALDRDASQVSG